ncbi:MAG: EF-hand domain-containing protein [Pseudomonadota bacterium]|nr:EF-hand domain-containing protein [Pseudomonadota bacterium]
MRFSFSLATIALLALAAPARSPQSQVQSDTTGQTQATGSTHAGRHGRHRLDERFQQANSTHDGHLTLDQAKSGKLKSVARHFDAIDKDHKGS